MKGKLLLSWALCSILAFAGGPEARAQDPMAALKGPVEEVIRLLKDPKYKDEVNREEQREKMWNVAREIFDFEAIARGTLKRHRWESFSPQQQQQFTDVFTRFLGNNYFNQIQGKYRNEQVVFLDQVMKDDTKALVKTKILREAVEIPVDYSMWKRGGQWRIYNVHVEGASLLGNYRNEFERVLQDDPPDRLIEMLREKVAAQEPKKAAS